MELAIRPLPLESRHSGTHQQRTGAVPTRLLKLVETMAATLHCRYLINSDHVGEGKL